MAACAAPAARHVRTEGPLPRGRFRAASLHGMIILNDAQSEEVSHGRPGSALLNDVFRGI